MDGFGKYGDIRLGGPDAKPEFSRWSWIAMFFCSGVGTSLIFWSSIEWSYYYGAPPFGIEKNTQAAAANGPACTASSTGDHRGGLFIYCLLFQLVTPITIVKCPA